MELKATGRPVPWTKPRLAELNDKLRVQGWPLMGGMTIVGATAIIKHLHRPDLAAALGTKSAGRLFEITAS
jgi:hypothetical protein